MPDLKQQLQEYVEANIERIDADDVRETVSRPHTASPSRPSLRPAWAFVLGAAVVLILGGMTWLLRAEPSLNDAVSQPETPIIDDDAAPQPETPIIGDDWNPILSTIKAGQPPPAATCPPGSNPNAPGLVDQSRPRGAIWSNQAAAFDQHAGRIVYIDEPGHTWTFDVCTNTWSEMNPTFLKEDNSFWSAPYEFSGQLVYDVDSDRTIAFTPDYLAVYDADTNTWTQRSQPPEYSAGVPGSGVIYDPASGLVVVQTHTLGLVAYDVDSDTWTPIGKTGDGPYPPFLVGYTPETDRLILLDGFNAEGTIMDPRTGHTEDLRAPDGGIFAGFGRLKYATSTGGPYVLDDKGDICRLHPTALEWDCINLAGGPESDPGRAGLLGAVVGDSINNRIVLIYGYGSGFNGERFYDVNAIWAIDFQTNEWTQLISATGTITHESEE